MKKQYLLLGLLLVINVCVAQQDFQYTQYMYNTTTLNPAYAGNRGVLSLTGVYRSQWVGVDGAPETVFFSGSTPIETGLKTYRVGLGFSAFNDKIGPSQESNLALDFSYTIPLDKQLNLSFGLKAGVNLLNVDFNKLDIFDPTDPNLENIDNRLSPIIGLGLYLRNGDKWYAGVSSPSFLSTEHYKDGSVSSTASEEMHVYVMGGYVFDINQNLKFKPAVLGKAVTGAPIAIDASLNFLYQDKFTFGASYRWGASISALTGFQVTDKLMIGYSYDYDTTPFNKYNSGSHEIFLRFELGTLVTGAMNPRFF